MKKILIYLIFSSTSLHAQVDTNLVEIKKFSIDSKILETERNYWVSLPLNYDSSVAYPVMYVLDAEWRFNITNALEKELSVNGKIPPHIVVGIPNLDRSFDMTFTSDTIWNENSEPKTNTGNGLKFLAFIEDELIEEVNHRYSTSGFNIIIGHSGGGYFCSYILPIQKSFQSLQIYDPGYKEEQEILKQIESKLTQITSCTIYFSSSYAYDEEVAGMVKRVEELIEFLKSYPNIHCAYKNYENEHHNSMYLYSFLDGMSMLYKGYELKMLGMGMDALIDVSILEKHFAEFSRTIRFEFLPQNQLYREVGVINFYQKKYQNCIDALDIYLEKNPVDPYALELIGDAYTIIGKRKQGLKSYTKAYEISPDNTRLKGKIEN
jgi:predicted alpha/beta superfamily hydrolase